jgi:trimethylamine--corrinoid protein Co-methyltransferase
MHQNALYLCETQGIVIPHDGVIKILSQYDGVIIEGQNVKFKSFLIEKALREAKYDLPEYAKDNWIIEAGAHQTAYYDLDTGRLREPGTQDLIDLIKLGDALDTVGSAPVVPLDVPPHLQHILMHKVSYEHSRYRCNDIYEHMDKPSYECAKYVYEMAQAAGKRFTFGNWMISPRTFDKVSLDVAYRLLDLGIPMWIATMPIAGVCAPITILGTVQQSMFEVFCGLTMLNLINTKSYNYISVDDAFEADAFDMKYSSFVYGSPEYARHTLHQISLCKYLNVPINAKTMLTASKEPDAHMAAEISAHTLIAALGGARVFRVAGLLSTGEIYSAEQLVLCHEITEYVKHLIKPEEFTPERLLVEEIAEVKAGQNFVGKKSTKELFRKEYWDPQLFTHTNLGQWQQMGSKSMRQYAVDRAKKLIARHEYRADEAVCRELGKIYERAKNDKKLEDSYINL